MVSILEIAAMAAAGWPQNPQRQNRAGGTVIPSRAVRQARSVAPLPHVEEIMAQLRF
jgi:hypothetical protein